MGLTWRYRRASGAKAMVFLAAATFIWTTAFLLEANSSTLERQVFFDNIGYTGVMGVPVAWFVFAMHYTSDERMLRARSILALCIFPLVTLVLIWSNDLHHLMWFNEHLATSGPFLITSRSYGPFFWLA